MNPYATTASNGAQVYYGESQSDVCGCGHERIWHEDDLDCQRPSCGCDGFQIDLEASRETALEIHGDAELDAFE